eukprot:233114-Pelagomonas_calceolata.AAC.2
MASPPILRQERCQPSLVWCQLSDGTLFNASWLAMHARLGRLVSAAEDLLPGICIISCGMERPRHSHELPVEEQGAFR